MVSHEFISFDAAIKRLEVQGLSPEELIGVIAYKEKNLDAGHVITSKDVSLRGIGRSPDPRREEMIEYSAQILGMVLPTWFISVSDFDRLTGKSEQRTKEWVDVNGRSDYWKDKDSMTGLITDWCEDSGLELEKYLKETRGECLESIYNIAKDKYGCYRLPSGRMKYGIAKKATYLGRTKTEELIKEAFERFEPI